MLTMNTSDIIMEPTDSHLESESSISASSTTPATPSTPSTPLSMASKPKRRLRGTKSRGKVSPRSHRDSLLLDNLTIQSEPTPTSSPLGFNSNPLQRENSEVDKITIRSPKSKKKRRTTKRAPINEIKPKTIEGVEATKMNRTTPPNDSTNSEKSSKPPKEKNVSQDKETTNSQTSSKQGVEQSSTESTGQAKYSTIASKKIVSFAQVKKERQRYYHKNMDERKKHNELYMEAIKKKYETLDGWKKRLRYADRLASAKALWALLQITSMVILVTLSILIVIKHHKSVSEYSCSISPYLYTALGIVILECVTIIPTLFYGFFNLVYATQGGCATYWILFPIGNWCTVLITLIQIIPIFTEGFLVLCYALLYIFAYDCFPKLLSTPFYYITSYFLAVAVINIGRLLFFGVYLALSVSPCIMPPKKKKARVRGHKNPDRVRSVHVSS